MAAMAGVCQDALACFPLLSPRAALLDNPPGAHHYGDLLARVGHEEANATPPRDDCA